MSLSRNAPEPIPAATLVLFRERRDGPPELLMVERAAGLPFAGGALVFPGGRVEAQDRALGETVPGIARDDAAERIAAIRETIEEAGVAAGVTPPPDGGTAAALRAGLHRGERLAELLDRHGLALELDALHPFARWRPRPEDVRRVYDTRFYLARAPVGAAAIADGTESVRAVWTAAAAALAEADAGRHRLIFPTRRNLERLATAASFAAACTDAARRRAATVTPWIERRDGEDWLCIPDDQGYPVTAERMATVRRG